MTPYFNNFVLDSLLYFGGGILVIFGIAYGIRIGQLLYALMRAGIDKLRAGLKN